MKIRLVEWYFPIEDARFYAIEKKVWNGWVNLKLGSHDKALVESRWERIKKHGIGAMLNVLETADV